MTANTVLVAGGTGLVGEGIVRALCASPAVERVVVCSRAQDRLDALRERLGDLAARVTAYVGDPGNPQDASRIVDAAWSLHGGLHATVASIGAGAADGRTLLSLDQASYHSLMHEMLGAHFAFARAVLPKLSRGGAYIGIGGGAAFAPMRGGGIISVAAAGQVMMTRVLEAERTRADLHIRELVIDAGVSPAATGTTNGAISPSQIGSVVEELVRAGASTWPALSVDGPIVTMRPLA
jgi:3-oxoacyl-[acyl-carrier protein] reductase